MAKKNHRRGKNNSNPGLMSILGVGLVLIGSAAFLLLQGTKNTEASRPVSRSVIPMEVNYPAPELSLQNVNGKTESLIDFRDKVVLVNNWATWCPPCKAEIPTLEAYYEAHAPDGFVIIGVEAGEAQEDVLTFAQEHDMTYPVWFDPTNAAMSAFHNGSLPSSYVIDRKGNIRLAWVGEINREMLEKYVTPLLMED
ncbi:MAG TPA: TlpA disulfide reductase family protein [Anaerolineales bacterium]|nr:TlpA disulfide reductase family protein [Anaerolineales bacterium]